MKYAVISFGSKQYKVKKDDVIDVELLKMDKPKSDTDAVLLVVDGDKVTIGDPFVKNAKVKFSLVENIKGEKIQTLRYRAKSRYRKTFGHRQNLSKIKIEDITLSK